MLQNIWTKASTVYASNYADYNNNNNNDLLEKDGGTKNYIYKD